MKTAAEWVNLWCADRDATINDYFKAIQLDARAGLLAELERVKKERGEAKRQGDLGTLGIMASLQTMERDRDEWKRLAEKFKCHSTHGASCDSYVDQDDEDCTCGLTTLLAEFEKKGNQP